jgi:hypothetical protein
MRLAKKKFQLVRMKINQDTTAKLSKLLGQLGENYFDYFTFNIVDCSVNCGLLHSGARRCALTNYRQWSGGSTSTRPGVQKLTLKAYDFIDISNTTISTALRGSTTTSPLIMIVILQQPLRLRSWLWFYDNNSTTSSSTTPCRPRRTQ